MDHAIVENGVVINIIWLYPSNAHEFPNAVPMDGKPISIGDTYKNGVFLRDGQPVLSALEVTRNELQQADQTIANLDALVVALTYENIMLELGIGG